LTFPVDHSNLLLSFGGPIVPYAYFWWHSDLNLLIDFARSQKVSVLKQENSAIPEHCESPDAGKAFGGPATCDRKQALSGCLRPIELSVRCRAEPQRDASRDRCWLSLVVHSNQVSDIRAPVHSRLSLFRQFRSPSLLSLSAQTPFLPDIPASTESVDKALRVAQLSCGEPSCSPPSPFSRSCSEDHEGVQRASALRPL
jgi:hypothetical protein